MLSKLFRYIRTFIANIVHPIVLKSGPLHFQVEVSTYCNLACVMCHHPVMIKNPKHMTLEQFMLIYDQIRPVTVSMSGIGEPFLNPDMIKMIEYAKKGGSKSITTSNLTTVSPELASKIVKSGLDLLKGSIDSSSPETYFAIRQRDMHSNVLKSLANIKEAKQRHKKNTPAIRLQFVIQKSNYREIIEVLDICELYGVEAINFQPLELGLEENLQHTMMEDLIGDLDAEDLRRVLGVAAEKAEKLGVATNLHQLFSNFDSVWEKYRFVQSPDASSDICIMPWSSTYITVDGDVRPCCSFPYQSEATIGNVFKDKFSDIWNSNKYLALRKAFKEGSRPYKICKNCIAPTVARLVKSTRFSKYMIFR